MTVAKKILLLIFLVCYCSLVSTEQKSKTPLYEEDNESDGETIEVFKPTHEWQIVKKGQPIPKGLHIRVNLETGDTEAKLLSDLDNERTDVLTVHDDAETEMGDDIEDHAKIIRESLVKLESQEKDKSNNMVDAVREKFRSYKELKESFQQLNMTVKTDLEIVHELIHKFKKLQRNQVNSSNDDFLTILTDLEYLVHQYDNALEFVKLDGVSDIVLPLLNCTISILRAEAARLLGSAAQSNVKVQIAALESGAISILLKAVSLDSDSIVRIRSMYALSCVIRNFPAAQEMFVKEGGFSVFAQLFDREQENHKLQIKVITLLHDLLLERQDTMRLLSESTTLNKEELQMKINQYNAVGLEKTLQDHSWCLKIPQVLLAQDQNWSRTKRRDDLTSAVTDLPARPEHDFIEKVSNTLLALIDICRNDFNINSDLKRTIKGLKLWYIELATKESLNKHSKHVSESSENDDEGYLYYFGIANILEMLTLELDKYHVKDEM